MNRNWQIAAALGLGCDGGTAMLAKSSRWPSVGQRAKRFIFPITFGFVAVATTFAWLSFLGMSAFRAVLWTFG